MFKNGIIKKLLTKTNQINFSSFIYHINTKKIKLKEQNSLFLYHRMGNISKEKGGIWYLPPHFEF